MRHIYNAESPTAIVDDGGGASLLVGSSTSNGGTSNNSQLLQCLTDCANTSRLSFTNLLPSRFEISNIFYVFFLLVWCNFERFLSTHRFYCWLWWNKVPLDIKIYSSRTVTVMNSATLILLLAVAAQLLKQIVTASAFWLWRMEPAKAYILIPGSLKVDDWTHVQPLHIFFKRIKKKIVSFLKSVGVTSARANAFDCLRWYFGVLALAALG